MRRALSWSLAFVILLIVEPSFGLDRIRVVGTAEQLQLELSNNTVDDALAALRSAFDLKCRCAMSLDRRVTGVYRGNIGRVLSRLLEGYDFVIKISPSGAVEAIVLGANAPANLAQAALQPILGHTSSPAVVDAMGIGIERLKREKK